MTHNGDEGYILASALAALFAMSLVAATLVAVSGTALARVKRMETAAQDKIAIDSAVRAAGSQLSLDPRRRQLSFENGAAQIQVGSQRIELSVSWEAARLDVNRASPEAIEALLLDTGLAPADLAQIVAEVRTAQSVGVPLPMLDRLDLPPDLLACANEHLTVFGGQLEYDAKLAEVTPASPSIGRPTAGARVRIDARSEGHRSGVGRTAVIMMTGDVRQPYRVLDWRELRSAREEACDETR